MPLPKNSIEAKLDAEINSSLDKLKELQKDSEEYAKVLERVSKLHKLMAEAHELLITDHQLTIEENQKSLPFGLKPPSLDTALIVAANIFGILWLTRYEKERVISSKALNFVMKSR